MILEELNLEKYGKNYEQLVNKDYVYFQCDYCKKTCRKQKVNIKRCRQTIPKDCCDDTRCMKQKRDESVKKKYGSEEYFATQSFKDKAKQTCLDKYGVENAAQSGLIKEKMKETCLGKYGVEYYTQTEQFQEAGKAKALDQYGVEYFSQAQEIKDKIKQTSLEKYEVDHFSKTEEFAQICENASMKNYGVKNVFQADEIKQQIKQTCLDKYGFEYPTQNEAIKEKRKDTIFERFGVKYPTQSKEIQERIKKSNLDKYGFEYPTQNEAIKEKILATRLERFGTLNLYKKKSEDAVRNWLNSFDFNFKPNASILKGKEVDMFDPDLKLGLEFCGLFWHTEKSKAPRDKYYHHNKYKKCKEQGIQLITLFEDEWKEKEAQCKSFLKSKINIYDKKIYARKCIVKPLDKDDCKNFLNAYHLFGPARSVLFSIGLFFEDELVSVISFGKHHRQNGEDTSIVLNRLCFKEGIKVIGGSKKLFKHSLVWCIENNYKKIISWSDNRWTEGQIYNHLGFILEKEMNPDYSYVRLSRPLKRISKQSIKDKVPEYQTESEWAVENNLARIWDCGKKRWVFELR